MPDSSTTHSWLEHFDISKEEEVSRVRWKYSQWPMDIEISVWTEIVRHKSVTSSSDNDPVLLISSTLKHYLPGYDWLAADQKLEKEVRFHMNNFDMPAWNRLMVKLVRDRKYNSLQVAYEHLLAGTVKSPRFQPGERWQDPFTEVELQGSPTKISMDDMIDSLCDIVESARAYKNTTNGYKGKNDGAQTEAEIGYIMELYNQDLEALRAKVAAKPSKEHSALEATYRSIGI